MRRIAFVSAVTSLVALTAAGVAFAGNGGFLPGEPHSPNAQRINDAYVFIFGFTAFIFVLVESLLIAFVIKYRRGKRARYADAPQIHGATRLEMAWTIGPVLILAIIAAFVFYKLPGIDNAPAVAASDQMTVQIEGHQFYWRFVYPNGAVSINKLWAPADVVVHEDVVGLPWDVNHSWWVPDLGGKVDAIPGQVNTTWFQAPVGDYAERCAELCGLQHAIMDATVHVVPRAQYSRFVDARAANPIATGLGKEEFAGVCMACHRLDHKFIGPALGGNPLLGDVKGISTLLRNGLNRMPAVGKNWTDGQIRALVSYTKQYAKGGS
ncbi:MAG TPA: cytochrome c oxidase subunit II [Gaiellaceae bacterium]